MNFSFDNHDRVAEPNVTLLTPSLVEIGLLNAQNRNAVIRFNDISEFTCDVINNVANAGVYDQIATRRFLYVTGLGYFMITNAVEVSDGVETYKTVTAESAQCVFRDIGFFKENRVYKMYNQNDETDSAYDANDKSAVPSVVGQMYQQLGIVPFLHTYKPEIIEDYGEWTLVYISSALQGDVYRSFDKDESGFGYDFMVRDVEEAFEVVVEFDYEHHAIMILVPAEATTPTDIVLDFDHLATETQLEEKSDEIVTVLNCEGSNLNITKVNPMGTNYICNFDYYKKSNEGWMSDDLIDALDDWSENVETHKSAYTSLVETVRGLYLQRARYDAEKISIIGTEDSERAVKYADVVAVRDGYLSGKYNAAHAFVAEDIEVGKKSYEATSPFYEQALTGTEVYKCYSTAPVYDATTGRFVFSGDSQSGALNVNARAGYLYFEDEPGEGSVSSYLKIIAAGTGTAVTVISVRRFTSSQYAGKWVENYDNALVRIGDEMDGIDEEVKVKQAEMSGITQVCNILLFFAEHYPDLLSELKCYWIEGTYENKHLAVLDTTTDDEKIDLANQLYESAQIELEKVAQPRFSLSVSSLNFFNIGEFKTYAQQLCAGAVISVEKTAGVEYQPALTSLSFSFDSDEFTLEFANRLKPNDWGFTYADLISKAANTSRKVEANWANLTQYQQDKNSLEDLLLNPLNRTLRMAEQNMTNQEFVIDDTGILGRRLIAGETGFSPEQVRLINNVILFTSDGWETVKTALGKISYTDGATQGVAYGLAAEVIVGDLVMSSRMKVVNEGGTIVLDKNGITITNPTTHNVVFKATPSGQLVVGGYVSESELETFQSEINARFSVQDGQISLSVGNAELARRISDEARAKAVDAETAASDAERAASDAQDAADGADAKAQEAKDTADAAQQAADDAAAALVVTKEEIISYVEAKDGAVQTKLEQTADSISLVTKQANDAKKAGEDAQEAVRELSAEFSVQAGRIEAKVNQRSDEYGTSSFGWEIIPNHFQVKSNSTVVMDVNPDGAMIAGWQFTDNQFFSRVKDTQKQLFLNTGDNSQEYWISALDDNGNVKFGVRKDGTLVATNALLTGNKFDGVDDIWRANALNDKYVVGEWSPAYGLYSDQAKLDSVVIGTIYIPTVDHNEPYSHSVATIDSGDPSQRGTGGGTVYDAGEPSDSRSDANYLSAGSPGSSRTSGTGGTSFSTGYAYYWDGASWSVYQQVHTGSAYVDGGSTDGALWYTPENCTHDGITYFAKTLYYWFSDSKRWAAVGGQYKYSGMVSIIDGTVTADYVNALGITVKQANIEGKLTAAVIDVDTIKIKDANIDGTLTADVIAVNTIKISNSNIDGQLTSSVLNIDNIVCHNITATNAIISGTIGGDDVVGSVYGAKITSYASPRAHRLGCKIEYSDDSLTAIKSGSIMLGSKAFGSASNYSYDSFIEMQAREIWMNPQGANGMFTVSALHVDIVGDDLRLSSPHLKIAPSAVGYTDIYIGKHDASSGAHAYISLKYRDNIQPNLVYGYLMGHWLAEFPIDDTYSDIRMKRNVAGLSNSHERLFDMLRPVTFQYKNDDNEDYHIGFIAQDVKQSMQEVGMSAEDFGVLTLRTNRDNQEVYGLRYTEFTALNTSEIQKAKKRIAALEAEVEALRNEIKEK